MMGDGQTAGSGQSSPVFDSGLHSQHVVYQS